MNGEEVKKFDIYGSMFVGAIFMSNHATKQECLRRKLFGLPSSKAKFVKQIKAGMLLFLFEHEERKLYGVFEATSDGAMNIQSNAFLSEGNSFPAQVLFKRIWMCKPLSEDEFHDAIKDNYFSPNKFHFGLSYNQVFKLLELFFFARINVKQYQIPGIPNEIIQQFEKCVENKIRVTGRGGCMKFDSDEYSRDDGIQRQARKPSTFVNDRRQLYQIAPHTAEARPPRRLHYESKPLYLTRSTSPNDPASSRNLSEHQMYGHHGCQGSWDKISSSMLGMGYPPLPQEPITHKDPMDMQSHSQLHTSRVSPDPLHFHPPNLLGSCFPMGNPFNVSCDSLPPVHSEDHLTFHDYKHTSHTAHYDPSNPRLLFSPIMPAAKGIETLPSVQPSNSHGYPETSRQEFDSGGLLCGGLGPPEYLPLPGSNCFIKNVGSSHSKSPRHDTLCKYSSKSTLDDDSHGMRPYPTIVKSCLYSDTEQSRPSVFSRLKALDTRHVYWTPEACCLSEGQEAFEKYEAQEPVMSFSEDQLETILSRRREQVEVTKVPKQPRVPDDDEKFESTAALELSKVTYPMDLEVSNDVIAKDTTAEESSEHLFLNFKRRSEIRRLSGENESNVYADSGPDEKTLQKYKRQKLLRPSFSEKECQHVLGTNQEVVGVKTAVESGESNIGKCELSPNHLDIDNKNRSACEASLCDVTSDKMDKTKTCESSRTGQLDAENKNNSSSKDCLGDVTSYKTESSSENLTTRRKEVSNRNLRWFLQKSVDGHAKLPMISDADHVTQKRKDESHMVSEVSVLPTDNKHGDEKTDGITEESVASAVDYKKY